MQRLAEHRFAQITSNPYFPSLARLLPPSAEFGSLSEIVLSGSCPPPPHLCVWAAGQDWPCSSCCSWSQPWCHHCCDILLLWWALQNVISSEMSRTKATLWSRAKQLLSTCVAAAGKGSCLLASEVGCGEEKHGVRGESGSVPPLAFVQSRKSEIITAGNNASF